MIALTNREILHELKTIGVNTKIDLVVSLIKYKVYLVCNNGKSNNRKTSLRKWGKMIIFLLGMFIGGFIGIIMMSIFFIGKREDILYDGLYRNIFS